MIPFVRTLEEGRQVIELLKEQGLERGKDGLRVIMMCELPSNALLADQFLEMFDGFSIGSNDLTQLTLGLDRDSGIISHLFDERNEAVKALLAMAIKSAKAKCLRGYLWSGSFGSRRLRCLVGGAGHRHSVSEPRHCDRHLVVPG